MSGYFANSLCEQILQKIGLLGKAIRLSRSNKQQVETMDFILCRQTLV